MKKTVYLIAVAFLSMLARAESDTAKKIDSEFDRIQKSYTEQRKVTKDAEEIKKIGQDRIQAMEDLLKKYEPVTDDDEVTLSLTKVMVFLKKTDAAMNKIDALIAKPSPFTDKAKLQKIDLLINAENVPEALAVFRSIEAKLPHDDQFYGIFSDISSQSNDPVIKEEYANKFLKATDVSPNMAKNKIQLYRNLADAAILRGEYRKAKNILEDTLERTKDANEQKTLQMGINQVKLYGKKAPQLLGDTWINSAPIDLKDMKGKVVIIDFWATWCPPCRQVIPFLVKFYSEYKSQGLEIIGFTKYYKSYRDERERKENVSWDDEIPLVQQFCERLKINYPIAISKEGQEFTSFGISAIPTMFFINKKRKIVEIKIGSGREEDVLAKIQQLLKE
jgi:thiol-disulfide isomerase/thioredoxin